MRAIAQPFDAGGVAVASGATSRRERIDALGVLVDRVDLTAAMDRIRSFVTAGGFHQVVTVNLDFVRVARRQPRFRALVNNADLAVADGMPLVWASRLAGRPLPERVTGVDILLQSCAWAADSGRSVFLLGDLPEVASAAAARLRQRFPGLAVAGTYSPPHGPFSAAENHKMVRLIQQAGPDFLFVAFGCPKQDYWIEEEGPATGAAVAIGVGGSFRFVAGHTPRAPEWMQRHGLEWAHRLRSEPGRLWRRYLVNDLPIFAWLMAQQSWAGIRSARLARRPHGGSP